MPSADAFYQTLIKALSDSSLMIYILLYAILALFSVKLFRTVRNIAITSAFKKKYSLKDLPYGMEIQDSPRRTKARDNYYDLAFPYWQYSTQDGSRDRRYRNNRLIYPGCFLFIDDFYVTCSDPMDMLHLVNFLRDNGRFIQQHALERKKRRYVLQQGARAHQLSSINSIVRHFEPCPSDFEVFCANLFQSLGYQTHVTSRSNDGGFDILMRKNYTSYIVECKCFSLAHPIGRPLLQKLVGANAIEKADVMVFITTSSFSAPAVEYARQFDMWLIDGAELFKLYQSTLDIFRSYAPQPEDWSLSDEDILAYYPHDCQ